MTGAVGELPGKDRRRRRRRRRRHRFSLSDSSEKLESGETEPFIARVQTADIIIIQTTSTLQREI